MEDTNTILIPIAFVIFITLTLASYFYMLRHIKWFTWKRNLIIIGIGFLLIVLIPLIVHVISNDLNIIMMTGIVIAGPTIGYSLASVKGFLDKNKNPKIIQTKNTRKDKNEKRS